MGNDILLGEDGGDRLNGDEGNDLLVGGTGPDVFGFGLNPGIDSIVDFDIEDLIDVSALLASLVGLVPGHVPHGRNRILQGERDAPEDDAASYQPS